VELNWFQCRSGSSFLGQCGSGYSSVSKSKDLMTKIAEFLSLGLHAGRPSYRRTILQSQKRIYRVQNCFLFVGKFFRRIRIKADQNQCGSLQIKVHNTGLQLLLSLNGYLTRTHMTKKSVFRIRDILVPTYGSRSATLTHDRKIWQL
jgi:hypothetical protein